MTTPLQTPWEAAVHAIAHRARQALAEASHSRIGKAVAIVLSGGVTLHPDGSAVVASQSQPLKGYAVNGVCPCKDYARAPSLLCKHKLALHIYRRAIEHTPVASAPQASDTPLDGVSPCQVDTRAPSGGYALPEAPASANCFLMLHGRQVQITLRDTDETRLLQRLSAVLAQYPASARPAMPTAATGQPQDDGGIYCALHGMRMQQQTNRRGSWYSHRLPEGGWAVATTGAGGGATPGIAQRRERLESTPIKNPARSRLATLKEFTYPRCLSSIGGSR